MNAKNLILGAVALAGFAATNAFAQTGYIANSKHNFSSYAWSGGEICKPCHTPHAAMAEAGALWNHQLTNATYTMFEGETGTAAADLDGRSRLCMSCHDGTVALDSFGGQTGNNFIPQGANIGVDLQDDHPIGADGVYPTTYTRFKDPATFPSTVRLRDWVDHNGVTQKVVSCGTCHTAHGRGFPYLLNMSNSASALCLTCHIK